MDHAFDVSALVARCSRVTGYFVVCSCCRGLAKGCLLQRDKRTGFFGIAGAYYLPSSKSKMLHVIGVKKTHLDEDNRFCFSSSVIGDDRTLCVDDHVS